MFDTLCTLPLPHDLFAQAIHPTEPLVTVGLSSGHVSTLRLPTSNEDIDGEPPLKKRRGSNGTDVIDTVWKTRRHKGSCRCLAHGLDGRSLYSAGTDGIVKAADCETGRVVGKVAVPAAREGGKAEVDAATVVHALSPQTMLLGTDSGALHLYDLRDPAPTVPVQTGGKTAFTGTRPAQTHHPHSSSDITSLTPLPPSTSTTSGYSKQFLTTGGTTLALTDLRRGVLVQSEDQEELLLSSLYVTGLSAKKSSGSTGEKALVGCGDGVITLWEKGQWDDQDERIVVSSEKETLDVMCLVPDGVGSGFGKRVAVGSGDGTIKFVQLGRNKVVGQVQHDELEGVIGLGFDVAGRMISGGGQAVKVWEERGQNVEDDEDEEIDGVRGSVVDVRTIEGRSDSGDEAVNGVDSSDEEKQSRPKKKKKRKKGKQKGGGGEKGGGFSFAGLD